MKRIISLIYCSLYLVGCSSPNYNYKPKSTVVNVPELGVWVTSSIGEVIVDQGNITQREYLYIQEDSEVGVYDIKKGKFIKSGDDSKYTYFIQDITTGNSIFAGLFSTPITTASLRIDKISGEVCILRPLEFDFCGDVSYKIEEKLTWSSDDFRQKIIFSGYNDGILKLSYFEYNLTSVGANINTPIEFDINDNKKINYNGANIDIRSVNDRQITYKVESYFRRE